MSKDVRIILLALWLVTLAKGQGTLLEMSQQLWTKLLTGGFSKAGKLDPLRVPVIKVDQSEGDTSYRIILRNVEITGLNDSTLESIHIARGRLKSNLSELEAGYVSYSDLRELDSIRYRFHTLVKEPKTQNESFEAIVSATNQESKFRASAREQDSRFERLRQYDPFLMKIQAEKMSGGPSEVHRSEEKSSNFASFSMEGARVLSKPQEGQAAMNPSDVQLIYAMSAANYGYDPGNYESKNYERTGSSSYFSGGQGSSQQRYEDAQSQSKATFAAGGAEERYRDAQGQGEGSFGGERAQERYENVQGQTKGTFSGGRAEGRFEGVQSQSTETFGSRRAEERSEDVQTSASENVESKVGDPRVSGRDRGYQENSKRLEKQPGYMDIVYADGSHNGSVKRFGNERIESRGVEGAKVYGFKDMQKDILENEKMISHNYTEGESLAKRNDQVKAAIETKKLEALTRYAKDYQEQQGYFEEGMQLIYHYGGMETKDSGKGGQGTRYKRAHNENATDDDVMHVILKIRVPLLRIKSDYQLIGKVGNELLRGSGRLNGNFSELVGDFTIELKKVKDQNVLIVRAARSKLNSKTQNVDLQGMNEQGPVKSILSHGLMAAEAVAAMLADDLATKALNDRTADAMIYKMYKNLPVNF